LADEKIRVSKQFKEIIDYVRARAALLGRKPPSVSKVTEVIAKRINKESLFENEFK